MGSRAISKPRDIRSALASAVLEWLLIFMLLVNAVFTYLISKFAQYCGLQAPCPLCSRLDHILGSSGSKKLKSYLDLVCRSHKLEISSLVLCHAHNSLADVHGMCETCLFSFATTNKSNAETYRLLVGKLGEEDSEFGDSSSEVEYTSKARLNCSCCNEPWTSRAAFGSRLMWNSSESIDSELAELGQDSPKINDRSLPASSAINEVDPLSHVEYTEVNADSDAECGARDSVHETHPLLGDRSLPSSSAIYEVDPLPHVDYTQVDADSDAECEARVSVHETQPLMGDVSIECEPMEPHVSSLPENSTSDPLAHVGYVGVKVDSDTESEAQVSDEEQDDSNVSPHETQPLIGDDVALKCEGREPFEDQVSDEEGDANAPANESHMLMEDVALEGMPMEPQGIIPPEVETLEKLVQQVSATDEPPVSESEVLLSSPVTNAHDFEELKWQQAEKAEPSEIPELICIGNEDPSPFIGGEFHVEEATTEQDKFISSEDLSPQLDARENANVETTSNDGNFISEDNVALPLDDITGNVMEPLEVSKLPREIRNERKLDEDNFLSPVEEVVSPVEGLKESNGKRTEEIWQPSATDSEQVPAAATTTETCPDSNHDSSDDNTPNWHNLLDLGDAYKLAIANNGRQLSGLLAAEQWLGKDSSRLSEDLRTLASQLSSGVREQSLSPRVSMSPRVPVSPKVPINGSEVQMLQKRMSLERNESGLSLDGTLVNEIEGESLVDRLKRQVEHDKKLLSALYKELEEERNASAVATNQAMAMITRLQDEKAALQMEAQQCLRLMEEQAEYDMDALQMLNDLLAEKERVIQELEGELEFYRSRFPDVEEEEETDDDEAGDIRVDQVDARDE